jgi:hypothetical protein
MNVVTDANVKAAPATASEGLSENGGGIGSGEGTRASMKVSLGLTAVKGWNRQRNGAVKRRC